MFFAGRNTRFFSRFCIFWGCTTKLYVRLKFAKLNLTIAIGIWGISLASFKGSISLATLPFYDRNLLFENIQTIRNTSVPYTQGHPSFLNSHRWSLSSTPMKIDDFWSSSQPKRKKDATTMAHMNMILIRTLKDNMNYDIPSRNRFLIYYFVLFLLH